MLCLEQHLAPLAVNEVLRPLKLRSIGLCTYGVSLLLVHHLASLTVNGSDTSAEAGSLLQQKATHRVSAAFVASHWRELHAYRPLW